MSKEYLFDKIVELKDKFKSFFQHRKKVTALENFSEGDKFPHQKYLLLVKGCLSDGFLDEVESSFLDHMLNKYEVNYLDWAHRTKWLKEQVAQRAAARPKPVQTLFDFEPKVSPISIPTHLLPTQGAKVGRRV